MADAGARRRRIALAVMPLALVLAVAPAAMAAATATLEACFLSEINSARAGVGAEPLSSSATLAAYGRAHSAEMAAAGNLYHSTSGDLASYLPAGRRSWGENVGYATGSSGCEFLFQGFWNSPNHRANLLNAAFDTVGIGVHVDASDVMWTTHVFVDTGTPPPTTTTTTSTTTTSTTTSTTSATTTTTGPAPTTTTTTTSTITTSTTTSTTTTAPGPTTTAGDAMTTSTSTPATTTTMAPDVTGTEPEEAVPTTTIPEADQPPAADQSTPTAGAGTTPPARPGESTEAVAESSDVPTDSPEPPASPVDPLVAAIAFVGLSGSGLAWWLWRR